MSHDKPQPLPVRWLSYYLLEVAGAIAGATYTTYAHITGGDVREISIGMAVAVTAVVVLIAREIARIGSNAPSRGEGGSHGDR